MGIIFTRGKFWRHDIFYAELLGYPKDVIEQLKREPNNRKRKEIFRKARLDDSLRLPNERHI